MQEVESAGGASGSDVSTNGGWWFWKGTLRFGGASEGTRVRRKPLPEGADAMDRREIWLSTFHPDLQ